MSDDDGGFFDSLSDAGSALWDAGDHLLDAGLNVAYAGGDMAEGMYHRGAAAAEAFFADETPESDRAGVEYHLDASDQERREFDEHLDAASAELFGEDGW